MDALDGAFPRWARPQRRWSSVAQLVSARSGTNISKQRAADQFLAYLEGLGRETLDQVQAQDLAGFWVRRQRQCYAPKTTGSLRSALADFLRYLRQVGRVREDLAGRLPPQRYPRRGESAPDPWTAEEVRLVLDHRSIGNRRSGNATTRWFY